MNRFKIARERGWPKIVCARYAGMTRMPGQFRRPYSVRGCDIDELHDFDYLPKARITLLMSKKRKKSDN